MGSKILFADFVLIAHSSVSNEIFSMNNNSTPCVDNKVHRKKGYVHKKRYHVDGEIYLRFVYSVNYRLAQ